ncbi:hypothetical protein Tco_0834620 [Tanacetum coccineum]
MRTRSFSNLVGESSPNLTTSNLRYRNRRRSKQPFSLEESPLDTMADQRTMAELLRAPTEGYAEAIVVPPILDEHFELKYSPINMMTSDQFFGLEKDNPHDHIRCYKDLLRACPHHGFTKLHQLDTLYNALNPADQDSLNSAAGGNLLERRTQDVLTIIENKSKVCNSRNKLIVSQVKSSDVNSSSSSEIAKFTHAVNQQTSAMTTAMTGDHRLIEELLNNDPLSPLPLSHNPLSGSTTSSSPDHLLEEFADELALITFPPGNDDLPFDIDSDLREIEYLLNYDPTKEMDSILRRIHYEMKMQMSLTPLINELDPPRSSDFLPSPECDSVLYEDFSEVDALPSTNNEDKRYLILHFYELSFHKEVPGSKTLLSFSSENEEKIFNPEILTSKGVHTSRLPKLSHRGPKAFKVIKIFESPMEIFPCSYGEDIRILDVPCLHFYPP